MARFPAREKRRNPLVAIVGPTASGKSDLAVQLAREFDGEIVSADSRQVYKGLDIGSGKISKEEMRGIPHYLLDIASPRRKFSVAQYQCRAMQAIASIHRRNKLPILTGGTPFYIYAVIDGYVLPEVKPNAQLRKGLAQLSVGELLTKLQKLDPERAKTIEQKNKRRLVRALEIVMTTGKPVPKLEKAAPLFDVQMIGIRRSPEELEQRIRKRLLSRIAHGMINEVKRLREQGFSWNRLEEFGLEYRSVAQYLQGKISRKEMTARIQKESEDLARRQMLWFKKDPRIHWISSYKEAKDLLTSKVNKLE